MTPKARSQRLELIESLEDEGRSDLAAVLTKCAEPVRLECLCCGVRIVVDHGCSKRWCPVCGPKITAKRYARAQTIIARMRSPLSLCLTRENARSISGQVESFKHGLRGFRRTQFWQAKVRGGLAGFEVTNKRGTWHVHAHLLIDCDWLSVSTPAPQAWNWPAEIKRRCKASQREVSEVWGGYIQQRDAIVHVRRADDGSGEGLCAALAETLKYSIKPAELLAIKGSKAELIDELDQGRLMTTFGNCHAGSKEFIGRDPPIERQRLCTECGEDRSLFPKDILDLINSGRAQPSARTAALIDRGHDKREAEKLGITYHELIAQRARADDDQYWDAE